MDFWCEGLTNPEDWESWENALVHGHYKASDIYGYNDPMTEEILFAIIDMYAM